MRAREVLVATRTKLVNHVHGAAKAFGVRLRKSATERFSTTAALEIPEQLKPALMPMLDTIAHLTAQIRIYEHDMREL